MQQPRKICYFYHYFPFSFVFDLEPHYLHPQVLQQQPQQPQFIVQQPQPTIIEVNIEN